MKSSKTVIDTPTKSKKSSSKEREKRKIFSGEAGSSSSNEVTPMSTYENDQQFIGFGPESIHMIAEQFINEDVRDDIAVILAEDISYRIREILQDSCINMRQGKRTYLKENDVNTTFKKFNLERIYGPAMPDWITFDDEDPNNLSCINEKELNLLEIASAEMKINEPGDIGLNYKWLKDTSLFNQLLVNNSLNNYSQKIMSAAVSSKKALRILALKDVAKNINIGPIIPHLCNFCFLILQKNITYSCLATPVLDLLEALMFNPCTSYSIEEKQMTLLIFLLLENIMNAANNNLYEILPICRTLGRLCMRWSRGAFIVVEKVKKYLLPDEPIRRLSAPVICALTYIGNDALNVLLWPHIDAMFKCLKGVDHFECLKLHTSILNAASLMYQEETWDINVHNSLYSEFGDGLVPLWRIGDVTQNLNQPETFDSDNIQSDWFNIRRALAKTMKIHSQQSLTNRSSQFKMMFRKARPPIVRDPGRQIKIVGYKVIPPTKCKILPHKEEFIINKSDSVNIISGRRTLFTLKRNFTTGKNQKTNSNISDLLFMM